MTDVQVHRGAIAADICALTSCTLTELQQRNKIQPPLAEWTATAAGKPVGYARAFRRNDGRVFVVPRGSVPTAWQSLVAAALDQLDAVIHVTVPGDDSHRLEVLGRLGFAQELESVTFTVPFSRALASLTPRDSTAIDIVPASAVAHDALFDLDIQLRGAVPGLDGWRGDRSQFDAELTSDDYDPSGYRVARTGDGQLVGLCRIWKGAPPSLGLLGVVPDYRTGIVARALLIQTLDAAQRWGSPNFETHTARPALQRRIRQLGGARTGSHCRMRFTP